MPSRIFLALSVAATSLLVACGSVPTRTFTFSAIDVRKRPVPCLVVVGGDWASAKQSNQMVNVGGEHPLDLELTFEHPQVRVTVAAVRVDPDTKKVLAIPSSSADSYGFEAKSRQLEMIDAKTQLFILESK